jgi:hypothetical protein
MNSELVQGWIWYVYTNQGVKIGEFYVGITADMSSDEQIDWCEKCFEMWIEENEPNQEVNKSLHKVITFPVKQ